LKILLTGPTGFIGKAFTRLAQSRGHEIAGLLIPGEAIPTDLTAPTAEVAQAFEPAPRPVFWLHGTLEEAPWKEITAFSAEVCVHTAWITTPGVYLESPENERFRDASLSFLSRFRDLGANHIVGLGTCIEYQITQQPLSEDHTPAVPTTTYARCKNQLRTALEADANAHGLVFCWGRVFYPYGPGEHPSRLCSSIIQKLARDEKIILKTPDSTKDYIYISDLAEALLMVVEKKFRGVINLGTGVGITVKQIAQTIGQEMGKAHLVEEASDLEPDPFPFVVGQARKLKSLGWRQTVTMEEGLARLVRARTAPPLRPEGRGAS